MATSDLIARFIMDSIEESERGFAELQRSALAEMFSCVPSQINYVISTRFSPEHGYVVESRRGGGGYIRITRAAYTTPGDMVMHLLNHIGTSIDEKTARAHIINLAGREIISNKTAKIMLAAVSDNCYRNLNQPVRDTVRASVFKQMLLQVINA